MSKLNDISDKAKQKAAQVAEQAKNYDYKSKVEQIKTKVTDIAEKAKDYDYKEKAKEITNAVKNFDYEEKAKEISDSVRNYDYKGEAENIKKGGFKYFWGKYKRLCIIAILVLVCISIFLNRNTSEWALRGLDTLNLTQTEVIKHEEKMSDSEQPEVNGVFVTYYDVEFLNYSAKLSYVFNNAGNQAALLYVVRDVELKSILEDIEDKLGKAESVDDVAPNYIWYKDNYKFNLIFANGEATFVVSDVNSEK